MANNSGKINLDITSILLALLENLASIDLDLKKRYFYNINPSNINKELFFYRQHPRLKPFLEENVWSSQVLLKYANNQTETCVVVTVWPVQSRPRVPVAGPGVGEEGPGPVAGNVAAPLHGPWPPPHAHPGGRLGAGCPVLKCLLLFEKSSMTYHTNTGNCDYYF